MIEPASEERDGVSVGQWPSRHPILRKLAASRVAQAASLDLPPRHCRREAALRIAGFGIGLPGNTVPLIQEDGEPLARVVVLSKPAPLAAGPIDVARAFAVACFATDADFRPRCMETIIGRVVILL